MAKINWNKWQFWAANMVGVVGFIYNSYDHLEKNLASGSGTYLETLIVLAKYDVRSEQDRQARIKTLRDGFADLAENPDYSHRSRYEKAEALYELVSEQVKETA